MSGRWLGGRPRWRTRDSRGLALGLPPVDDGAEAIGPRGWVLRRHGRCYEAAEMGYPVATKSPEPAKKAAKAQKTKKGKR